LELAGLYIGNMGDGHARVKMEEVKAAPGQHYSAWIGGTDADSVFYYRISGMTAEGDSDRPISSAAGRLFLS
jgi:hypothetical protein